jgi:hypothetical protein
MQGERRIRTRSRLVQAPRAGMQIATHLGHRIAVDVLGLVWSGVQFHGAPLCLVPLLGHDVSVSHDHGQQQHVASEHAKVHGNAIPAGGGCGQQDARKPART